MNEFTRLGDLIDPQKYQRKIHHHFLSCANAWRENPNPWRAITRLDASVQVAH
jgi:hypothetical protein